MNEEIMKYALIPFAAIVSASAQVLLKKTSGFENWSRGWFLFMLLSLALYGASFFMYMYLLRLHPISRIYPTLTVLVILMISAYGFLIGEKIGPRQLAGLALGVGSIYVLLS
jgi:drug/metabolite transporter (DMT)-like permease